MDEFSPARARRLLEDRLPKRLGDQCRHWAGQTAGNGVPRVRLDGRLVDARRVLVFAMTGRELPSDWRPAPGCGDKRCLNPRHIRIRGDLGSMHDVAQTLRGKAPA